MELKGSRTEANLMAAIAGESQARNKYIYYAEQARKDGFEQIADIFEETALNEQTHAYLWTLHIRGGSLPKTEDALKYEVEAMEAAIEGNLEDDCQIITKDTMRILTSIKTQWGMKYPFE